MGFDICLFGICIPAYIYFPLLYILLPSCWRWFSINILGNTDEKLYPNSRVIGVHSMEQWKTLHANAKETGRSMVVDFTASWCGPCEYIKPFFHELSERYPCTMFLKVDVDEMKIISQQCGIRSMPTFHYYKRGVKCDELIGANKSAIEEKIKQHNVEVQLNETKTSNLIKTDKNSDLRQRKTAGKSVVAVKSESDWTQVQKQAETLKIPLVVDFGATWCGPCQDIVPLYETFPDKYPSLLFAKVDVDEMEDLMESENVSSLPTFKVYKNGTCVDELSGAIPSALESMISKYL